MATIWNAEIPSFDKLGGDAKCDVVIIGGGVAGLWCGYKLAKAGKKVCIFDSKTIGSGVTSGSSAILTYAHDDIYHRLTKKHNADTAKQYLGHTQAAIEGIVAFTKAEGCDIDLEPIDYILFSQKRKGKRCLKKELKFYNSVGASVARPKSVGLPYRVKFALNCPNSYQFNPLKLVACLAKAITKNGGRIFEKTHVTEAPDGNTLRIGNHTITAQQFIIATHYPYINFPGFYWLKMYQEQNYCMGLSGLREDFCKGVSFENIDKKGFEYRRIGDKILVDGASIRTGQKPYRSKYRILEKHINTHFGRAPLAPTRIKETERYVAQDCMTLDMLPFAGRYSHFLDNVFVVTGFNKWGMTGSYVTAGVVTDMILGKRSIDQPFKENIYCPQRNILFTNIIETVANVGMIAAQFANDILNLDAKKFERIKNGQGAIIKYRGHRVGASRDKNGNVRLIHAICPHLGCNLKWNKDERTFDCPCHGSRFDTDGKIINNPAIKCCHKVGK